MSYKCENCKKTFGRYQKPTKTIIQVWEKTYPVRKNKMGDVIDKGGNGWEIGQEASLCKECSERSKNGSL
jgi:hypothetical protein